MSSLLPTLMLAAQLALPWAACVDDFKNCNDSKCCTNPKSKCFEKVPGYAICNATCVKGIHKEDPKKEQKPWSCKTLWACAWEENCLITGCCNDKNMTCFAKDDSYGACMHSCKPGKHKSDPKAFRTKWSCDKVTEANPRLAFPPGKEFEQCGGQKNEKPFMGTMSCVPGCTCKGENKKQEKFYKQCLPHHKQSTCEDGLAADKKKGKEPDAEDVGDGDGASGDDALDDLDDLDDLRRFEAVRLGGLGGGAEAAGRSRLRMSGLAAVSAVLAAAGVSFAIVARRKLGARQAACRDGQEPLQPLTAQTEGLAPASEPESEDARGPSS